MCRKIILLLSLQLFFVIFLISCTEVNAKHSEANEVDEACCGGRCIGSAYCRACRNCNSCNYCNSGGSCGVCAGIKKKTYYNSYYSNEISTALYIKKVINLREYPSLQAPIIIQIPKETQIYIKKKERSWYYISCYILGDYYEGYIHQTVIK
ncbi:SH3 domain-containing protein [Capnocytophaga genosp. AHN8471]|jgi:SH3, type 3 domain protein|uniref:SH3 domain-containing protein n=1 Tax=Capnocytophaga genosp. AHN8471 TaxID=327574 RepID=UPI001932E5D4|nr:SH3 domain-containing protein [Capnocytophaga genosp. AHN8471]MBM0657634.1 SH3 domain-containing protein [Capnocytophaga genosp. AHN8471]